MTNERIVARIQAGESHFVDLLLEQNKGMIYRIARRYGELAARNGALDMDDLTQAASLGVIEAIPAWDESRGSFLTVAVFYMRHAIQDTLGIRSKKERIENTSTASLDALVGEEDACPLVELIPDSHAIDPQQAATDAELVQVMREAVDILPEGQRRAVWHRLYGGQPQGDKGEAAAALVSLRRNRKVRWLWEEYRSVPYWHIGLAGWKYDNTSATEAAVIRRDAIRERMVFVLNDENSQRCKYGGGVVKRGIPFPLWGYNETFYPESVT